MGVRLDAFQGTHQQHVPNESIRLRGHRLLARIQIRRIGRRLGISKVFCFVLCIFFIKNTHRKFFETEFLLIQRSRRSNGLRQSFEGTQAGFRGRGEKLRPTETNFVGRGAREFRGYRRRVNVTEKTLNIEEKKPITFFIICTMKFSSWTISSWTKKNQINVFFSLDTMFLKSPSISTSSM